MEATKERLDSIEIEVFRASKWGLSGVWVYADCNILTQSKGSWTNPDQVKYIIKSPAEWFLHDPSEESFGDGQKTASLAESKCLEAK